MTFSLSSQPFLVGAVLDTGVNFGAVGTSWQYDNFSGNNLTLTYSFSNNANSFFRSIYQNTLNEIASFTNIVFNKLADEPEITNANPYIWQSGADTSADLRLSQQSDATQVGGLGIYYVWQNDGDADVEDIDSSNQIWSINEYTIIHELGHALTLKHTSGNQSPSQSPFLPTGQQNNNYTVMHYELETDSNGGFYNIIDPAKGEWDYRHFQVYDVYALQLRFGINTSTYTGNSNHTATSLVMDQWLRVLWDASGIDTIDMSIQSRVQKINLNQGSFSDVGTVAGNNPTGDNLAIAFGAQIENATGGSGADTITGNTLANILIGNGGNDTINAGDGDDSIRFSGSLNGLDIINGGNGNDTILATSANTQIGLLGLSNVETINASNFANVSIILSSGADNYNFAGTSIVGISFIDAGAGSDTISGITAAFKYFGGAGDDNITGGANNDVVYGDAGNDILSGGGGDDLLYGFSDNDTLNGDAGNDVLFGGDGDDVMNGGAGLDVLYAGAGANTLAGGADRDDYYDVDADDIVNELAGGGYDVIFAVGNVTLGLTSEVELIVTGAAVTAVTGSNTANYIVGNALNNDFRGLSGNDYLVGNAGSDALDGGDGDDVLLGGDDRDYLYGGAGADYFEGNAGDDYMEGGADRDDYYWIEAGDTIVEIAGGGYDVIWAIGNVTLGVTSDVELIVTVGPATAITGSNTANYIVGNASAATYNGLGGDDVIVAAGGDDVVLGGAGADSLYGDDGNDIIEGGAGQDYLSGGSGADIFRISDAGNFDQLVDFQTGVDQIALSNAVFSHTAAINFISGAGPQSATNANSTFLHDTTTGYVTYDADGNGSGAAVYILLAGGAAFAASDFVFY